MQFSPIVYESYGSLGKLAIPIIDDLTDRVAGKWKHIPQSVVKDFWIKKLSFEAQRGTARMLIDRTQRLLNSNYHSSAYQAEELGRDMQAEAILAQQQLGDGSNEWQRTI